MSAGDVEIVDISPLGDGPYSGRPETTRGGPDDSSWRPAGPRVGVGGLLLIAAAVFSLLTIRGEAWTSTATIDQGRSVHTDLSGNSVVTEFDLPRQVTTTRLDGWGRTTVTTVFADSGNPGVAASGSGPKLGLGFLIGAAGVALAAALLAAAQRWSGLTGAARTASIVAAALLTGIWVTGLISVLGAHDELLSDANDPSVLDRHGFHLGNSVYLGLVGTGLAVAAAILLNWPRTGARPATE